MSEWISPGGVPRGEAVAQVPRLRRLGLAGGEEGDQAQQREGLAHDAAARPGLADAELRAHRRRVVVLELGQLGLDARGDGDGARALRCGVRGDLRGDLLGALVDVGDEQHRLGRQRAEVARRVRRLLGHRHAARRAPGLQLGDDLRQPRLLGDGARSPPRACLVDALEAPLGLLEVGEHELGLDRLDVAQRVDAALGVDHVLVAVRAHDVHDRVGLADVREEAVAEPLALVRAGDEAGDVVEVDRVPDDLRRADRLRRPAPGARRAPARRRRSARSS